MVAGYHLIWTAYGWWLPNDPRGSSSDEIRIAPIAELGELHHGRKSIQPRSSTIRSFYQEASDVLKHSLLTFNDEMIAVIGNAFDQTIRINNYTCYASAIMPDHVHLLIRRHRDKAEEMIEKLQTASREELLRAGLRAITHPVWGGPGWKVFLNTQQQMERTVGYIQDNPLKIGRPFQEWPFVKDYDGWMPGYRGG